MADDLKPLIAEMQKTNALTATLLQEKRADDTPKQLLMGNLFEILAQYDIFKKTKNELDDIEREAKGTGKATALAISQDKTKQGSLFGIQTVLEELYLITVEYGNLQNRYSKAMFDMSAASKTEKMQSENAFARTFNMIAESSKKVAAVSTDSYRSMVALARESQLKLINPMAAGITKLIASTSVPVLASGTGDPEGIKVNAPYNKSEPKSAEEEKEKDNRTFLQKTIGVITNPISSLGTGIKKLGETFTVGNAALVTVLTLIVTGLIAFFPAFSGFVAGLINMVGAIFKGDGKAFGQAVGDNLGGLFILGLFLARKAIASKFMAAIFTPYILPQLIKFYTFAIGNTLTKAAVAFLKFNPIGLIIGILLSFFALFGEKIYDYFERQTFRDAVAGIVTMLFDLVKGAIKGIGSLLGFGGGAENKFMGGTVAAGSPYIVGERGPELFVPGASGSIVPNGAMGGAPVIVNNNSVNQSSASHNHQHSNVSITDSQQEITGL